MTEKALFSMQREKRERRNKKMETSDERKGNCSNHVTNEQMSGEQI